ncbi:MAG: EamA family transporter [Acidobacteria bacterium]|nr:EamA family transporter [Acidobacteriota bacterium]
METQLWAVACVVVSTMLAALAAFLLKRGSRQFELSRTRIRIGGNVLGAAVLYVLAAALFFVGLLGGPLSVLFPITAVEYVWVVLLARGLLRERIDAWKAAGIACIAAGVILVGLGS